MFARFFWALSALFVFAQATGDFVVLHTPESVTFRSNQELDQSLLRDVFSAALGFTVKTKTDWAGLSINGPFYLPEAVVAVAVEGVDSLKMIKGKKYPLNVDESEETTWQTLSGRIQERDNDNTLIRIYLGDGLDALGQSALGELKPTPINESSLKALSLKNDEDRKFIDEVQLLHAIAKKVPTTIRQNNRPDVFWFVVSGLKPVFDLHGQNSLAAKEAVTLLNEAMEDVSKAFIDVYKTQVLITAFTNDASQVNHNREVRQAKEKAKANSNASKEEADEESEKKKNNDITLDNNTEDESKDNLHVTTEDNTLMKTDSSTDETDHEHIKDTQIKKPSENEIVPNLAPAYSDDYPVIFNIILWSGVIFFFSLLAICITIAEMDPGRDSIIYRMTSNRMKKDN